MIDTHEIDIGTILSNNKWNTYLDRSYFKNKIVCSLNSMGVELKVNAAPYFNEKLNYGNLSHISKKYLEAEALSVLDHELLKGNIVFNYRGNLKCDKHEMEYYEEIRDYFYPDYSDSFGDDFNPYLGKAKLSNQIDVMGIKRYEIYNCSQRGEVIADIDVTLFWLPSLLINENKYFLGKKLNIKEYQNAIKDTKNNTIKKSKFKRYVRDSDNDDEY